MMLLLLHSGLLRHLQRQSQGSWRQLTELRTHTVQTLSDLKHKHQLTGSYFNMYNKCNLQISERISISNKHNLKNILLIIYSRGIKVNQPIGKKLNQPACMWISNCPSLLNNELPVVNHFLTTSQNWQLPDLEDQEFINRIYLATESRLKDLKNNILCLDLKN